MLHTDIERFLGTLLYPFSDPSLLYDDPLQDFLSLLPDDYIQPQHTRKLLQKRNAVYAGAVRYVEQQCSLSSYDEIHQYMERWYLGRHVWQPLHLHPQPSVYDLVIERLRDLSCSMISKLDGKFTYKYWEHSKDAKFLGGFVGSNKIHLFRGLTQRMPLDLLVVIFLLEGDHKQDSLRAFRGSITITDSLLEQIMKKGVAENHLHMGVSAGFPLIWEHFTSVSHYVTSMRNNIRDLQNRNPSASPQLAFYICLARYLRMWLAIFSVGGLDDTSPPISPQQLIDSKQLWQLLQNCTTIDEVLDTWGPSDQFLVDYLSGISELDYLRTPNEEYSEGIFLYQLLSKLDIHQTQPEKSKLEKQLFLQYLRVKHHLFQELIQHKRVGGLNYFQNYYGQFSQSCKFLRNTASSEADAITMYYRQLILAQLSNPHIRKVEFRTSFPPTISAAHSLLRTFLSAYRDILHKYYCHEKNGEFVPTQPLPRIGLVFHFIKSQQEHPDLCVVSSDEELCCYETLHKQYEQQLNIFLELRNPQKYPGIDRYLVGIDIASLENAVPTWVFTDLYEAARDGKSEPFHMPNAEPYQSLGFTCHAGEDFRYLMSGLRRIYESIHYLKFHAGDRIGHGIALGVDVNSWCADHPNVLLPRIEALENYLWAYKMLSTYPSTSSSGDLLYLEQRIHSLSHEIFRYPSTSSGDTPIDDLVHVSTSVLLQSYELLFSEHFSKVSCGRFCHHPDQHSCNLLNPDVFSCDDVLKSYHCFHYTHRMQEVIHYHLSPQEIAILKTLQTMMQELVSRTGVIVEVNPSSNIIIGPMDTIHQHHLYNLSSYRCDYKDLIVCVNSDDPGVFQTDICNELGIAYMGMVERGIGREACIAWADKLRENGMRYSFIRRSDSDEALLHNLDELIDTL